MQEMRDALHAEWTKLRTLASTYWLLLAAAVLTVGVSTAVVAASSYQPNSYQDTPKLSLTGIYLCKPSLPCLPYW
jgi:ABC-2 type transport system permease protein